jgi:hypothetical protein
MIYQLLKNALPRDAEIDCAVCGGAAEHRLLVPPVELLRTPRLPIAVPPEHRGLCHQCGRGRHSLSFLDDEEILHLQRLRRDATLAAAAMAAAPTAADA